MRKQYHFRQSAEGLLAWDVDRLAELTKGLPTELIPLSSIAELAEPYWFGDGVAPTVLMVVEHARLIEEADLSYPIILSPDGRVMDGMHRVAKAALRGQLEVQARRLPNLPPPNYVGVEPEDLPY